MKPQKALNPSSLPADSVAVVGLKLAADKVGVVRSEVTVRWVVEGGVPAAD